MGRVPDQVFTIEGVVRHFECKITNHQARYYRETTAFWLYVYENFIVGKK